MSIDNRKPYWDTLHTEFAFPSRRRTSELTVTTHRWFLSACYRKADTARPAPPAEV